MSGASAATRPRHVPQRTCVVCRGKRPKQELVRLVRASSGGIAPDPAGRAPGRGAYLCRASACWDAAATGGQLSGALKTSFSDRDREQLRTFAADTATDITDRGKETVHDD